MLPTSHRLSIMLFWASLLAMAVALPDTVVPEFLPTLLAVHITCFLAFTVATGILMTERWPRAAAVYAQTWFRAWYAMATVVLVLCQSPKFGLA